MANLTVYFDGLCGFVSRTNEGTIEAYLFSGCGHNPQLVIPTDILNIRDTSWMPTAVGLVLDGGTPRQVGVWSLAGVQGRFADGTGLPRWARGYIIDFKPEHGGSTPSRADIRETDPKVGIVSLAGGTLAPQTIGTKENFKVVKNGISRDCILSEVMQWTPSSGAPSFERPDGDKIAFRQSGGNGAWWANVSNVSPARSSHGLHHFAHYYDALPVNPADRITIERLPSLAYFADVYDCVPPVALP